MLPLIFFMEDMNKEKAVAWLNVKWKSKVCEVCGNSNWTMQNSLSATVVLNDDGLNLGSCYPQYVVICLGCANLKSFSSVLLHTIIKEEEEKKDLKEVTIV
jgi:hypothetical protein